MAKDFSLTGRERTFSANEIIVSKTDAKGRMIYANDVLIQVGGYSEQELLGQPHAIVRHPHMPRCIFKLLWERIRSGREMFAYVLNRAKDGDHYWVFAHVTPNLGPDGAIIGYHSSRRSPKRAAVDAIRPLYAELLAAEQAEASPKAGMEASLARLDRFLAQKDISYDRFVLGL